MGKLREIPEKLFMVRDWRMEIIIIILLVVQNFQQNNSAQYEKKFLNLINFPHPGEKDTVILLYGGFVVTFFLPLTAR